MDNVHDNIPATEAEWRAQAAQILKSELSRHGVKYAELRERLAALGIEESYGGLATKINRGKFSFTFFLQCMKTLDKTEINLDK
jgi:hypothetical protein